MKQKIEFSFDESVLFSSGKPDNDKPMNCKCGWSGNHIGLTQRRYTSDAHSWETMCGRDGWHYHCPRCNRLIDTYYFIVS